MAAVTIAPRLRAFVSQTFRRVQTARPGGGPRAAETRGLCAHPGFEKASGCRRSDSTAIEIGIEPSRRAERGMLEGLVTAASFAGLQQQFAHPERLRESVHESMKDVDSTTGLPPDQKANVQRFLASLDQYLGKVDTSGYQRGGPEFSAPRIAAQPVVQDAKGPRSAISRSRFLRNRPRMHVEFAQSLVTEHAGTCGARSARVRSSSACEYLAGVTIIALPPSACSGVGYIAPCRPRH
jgi:hypothetical protein